MTKEQLGSLILDSERQLYSTAKTILFSDYDCADAIQETIVKSFSSGNIVHLSYFLPIYNCEGFFQRRYIKKR